MKTHYNSDIQREEIEIMAPVGSYESLMAAVQSGADSVYFGIEQLNMRARASNNFTFEDLKEIVRVCNEHNIKTYLTVNTIIYDHEVKLMHEVIDAAAENNVTAVIASDMAVVQYAFEKGMEIHASTQLNISNFEAVKFFSRFCDVMVTARELNLNQVAEITKRIEDENICGPKGNKVQIEVFTHGALCMAISGKCYMSLHEKNLSANRGSCMQTCRKGYEVSEIGGDNKLNIDHEYIMSPKDLCTLPFLDRVIKAGIKVLKIEGRARSAEYVKTVVNTYNEALDAIFDNTFSEDKIQAWEEKLKTVFNRGFWDGYYLGRKTGEWSGVYGSIATKRKVYLGKCTNYFSKIGVAEFTLDSGEVLPKDEVLILGETTGVLEMEISEMRVDFKKVNKAVKGEELSIKTPELVRRGDKLYKLVPNSPDLMQ